MIMVFRISRVTGFISCFIEFPSRSRTDIRAPSLLGAMGVAITVDVQAQYGLS